MRGVFSRIIYSVSILKDLIFELELSLFCKLLTAYDLLQQLIPNTLLIFTTIYFGCGFATRSHKVLILRLSEHFDRNWSWLIEYRNWFGTLLLWSSLSDIIFPFLFVLSHVIWLSKPMSIHKWCPCFTLTIALIIQARIDIYIMAFRSDYFAELGVSLLVVRDGSFTFVVEVCNMGMGENMKL